MGIIGGIGVPELLIILAVCLLIFGPKNLPKLGASLGKTMKSIRKGMEDDEDPKKSTEPQKIESAVDDDSDADVPAQAKEEEKTAAK